MRATLAATLKDIARECQLDTATVSRALSGAYGVRHQTRQKVQAAALRLNYRPNRLAKGLATGQSRTLALVISDIRNPFFAEQARGAEDAAYQAGYDLILCNSDLSATKQMHYIHFLLEKRVDGILISTAVGLSATEQEEISRSGVPVVLFNRPPARVRGYSTVRADNYEGGYLAGRYLIHRGHRVIGHVTGPRQHGNLTERANGFQKATAEANVSPLILRGHQNSESAYEMMKKLLAQSPHLTAVFAGNDTMAFGAVRAIFDAGKCVPEDISVIGFDNVELAEIIRPPLTTIHQPKYEMGWAAVEILLKQVTWPAGWMPEHRLLEVKLVERQSCKSR